jgi:hypothetical protein
MFTSKMFLTLRLEGEVKRYELKHELKCLSRIGYKDTLKLTYEVSAVPYPNAAVFETVHREGMGITTTKRVYLTEGRVVFCHYTETRADGAVLASRLIYLKTIPEFEFLLMLPPVLEPYYA